MYTPGSSERRGGTSKFLHGDALGSTRGITAANQSSTDTVLYDAFGQTVNRTGSSATPFGFVGGQEYQTDGNSGLMLLGHRYYDSSIGRFITRDTAKDGDNWYAYCENEPLNWVDSDGQEAEHTKNARPSTSDKHTKRDAGDNNNAGKGKGGYDKDHPKNPPQDERKGPPDRRDPESKPGGGRRQGGGDRRKGDRGRGARSRAPGVGISVEIGLPEKYAIGLEAIRLILEYGAGKGQPLEPDPIGGSGGARPVKGPRGNDYFD